MVTSSCPPLNCQGQPSDSLHRGRMSYVPIDVLVARVSLAEQLKGSCKRLQGHSLAGGFSVYKTCRKLHHIHFMQSVRMTLKNTFSYIFSFHIHVAHVNLSSFLERTYKAWTPAASAYLLLLHAHDGPSTTATLGTVALQPEAQLLESGRCGAWCPGWSMLTFCQYGVLGVRLLHGWYELRWLQDSNRVYPNMEGGCWFESNNNNIQNLSGFEHLICLPFVLRANGGHICYVWARTMPLDSKERNAEN